MRRQVRAVFRQGDREIFPEDIAYIRSLAQRFPGLSRKELTYTLCEHLHWLTPAGQPKFTACSKLLQRLEEAGEVCLPSIQKQYGHPGSQACSPIGLSARSAPQAQLKRSLSALAPVGLRLATTPADEALCNEYLERYHPLGYKKPFGYWARYFIDSGPHRLGCVLLSAGGFSPPALFRATPREA